MNNKEYNEALTVVIGAAKRLAILLDENDQVMQGKLISEAADVVESTHRKQKSQSSYDPTGDDAFKG